MAEGFSYGRLFPYMEIITNSLTETKIAAKDFIENLSPLSRATLIGLSGELGSGKTSFTQGVASALGVTDAVNSPTFVLEKIYELENQKFNKLIHIDAYRFDDPQEIKVLRLEDLLDDPKNLILIEWPEKAEGMLPSDIKTIHFKFIDENKRQIDI